MYAVLYIHVPKELLMSIKTVRSVLFAIFACFILAGICSAQNKKPSDLVGEYDSNSGTVRISYGQPSAKTIDFRVTIVTDNGCEGEISSIAKPVKGKKNFYVWEEKLSEDKNYGKNARYRLEITFFKNKVVVKERSFGTNRDVTYYRGMACTFNGTFSK